MKATIHLGVFILLLLPVIAAAQEPQAHPLAGSWRGAMVEGGGEDAEVTIELRIEGDVVTGPIATSRVADLYIRNGSVTGNTIQFTSPSLDPATEGALVWTGQLTGNNEIAFSVVREASDAPPVEFVVTKREPVPGGR